MSKPTPRQKDAIERLRGNPEPTRREARENSAAMRAAAEAWKKLSAEITAALAATNPLLAMEVAGLEAMYDAALARGWQPGQNVNNWHNPYPLDDPRSLLCQYQFISFHDQSDNVCDIWSRQTGKGFNVGLLAAERCYKTPRTRYTIASPSERQSLLTLEKAVDGIEAFGLVIEGDEVERDGSNPQALITSKKITLSNGSTIRGVPGLPRTLRGDTGNLIIDEGDHIENPQEFMRAVIGIVANEMAGKKQLRFITTPLGKNSPSYKYANDPSWTTRVINIWQAVLMGIKQNPHRLRKLYGDDLEGWMQEMLCVWLDAASVLLPYELIQGCESIEASENDTPELLKLSPLRKIGGIDFGRVSDPTVMTTALTGLDMSIVRNVTRLKGMSTPDQINTLAPYIELCDCVAVDNTGPGVGFCDLAVAKWGEWNPEKHLFGKIMPCTFTLPFKRVIFPNLRTAFEKRTIRIPVSTWLREDLHAVNIVITQNQYNYKAPRSDEGHSDGCTALALMEHARRQKLGGIAAQSIATMSHDQRATRGGLFDGLTRRFRRMG